MTPLLQAAFEELAKQPEEVQERILRIVLAELARMDGTNAGHLKREAKAGSAKGLILYMTDDFDAPLEDFKDYM